MIDPSISLERVTDAAKDTMAEVLGIEFTEIGSDHLAAQMPVDRRTHQPMGILHGGASIALAETVGSVAANLVLQGTGKAAVGMEVNGNHLRSVRDGFVDAVATPLHVGGRSQVWQIEIRDDQRRLVCASRLTMAVIDAPPG